MLNKFFLTISLCFLLSCGERQHLSPNQYLEVLKQKEKELTSEFVHDNHIFSFEYRPSDVFIAEQFLKSTNDKEQLIRMYSGLQNFILNIKPINMGSGQNNELQDYAFQKLEGDISMIIKDKNYLPSIYSLENLGKDDGSVRIFLSFEALNHNNDQFNILLKANYFSETQFDVKIPISKLPILKI